MNPTQSNSTQDLEIEKFLDEMGATPDLTPEPPEPAVQNWLARKADAEKTLGIVAAENTGISGFLWPGLVREQSVTIVSGDAFARAHLFCDLAARVSAGAPTWVDGQKHGCFEWDDVIRDDEGKVVPAPWYDAEPQKVITFVTNPQDFTARFKAYGGNVENLHLGGRIKVEDITRLKSVGGALVIIDTLPLGSLHENQARKVLEALRACETTVLVGAQGSTRREVAGSSVWLEADGCWSVRVNGPELLLNHGTGTLAMDITPEGLRDGRQATQATERTEAEWWLLGRLADGEKHPRQEIIALAEAAGFSQRQVEFAFSRIGAKWENTAEVPRRTLWWLP